jgi:sarcosine oxidase subunit alpha
VASFDFEGREVPFEAGDTIASALYRAGVRTFSRSIKYHRRRGLYCLSGDCPNCQLSVDGEPGVRSCCREASEGLRVERETGWPSTERDVLAVADRLHPLLPVGFYYKTFIRPRWAWPLAERVIRRATGVGRLPVGARPRPRPARWANVDVLVIGGGVAGLAAARSAVASGAEVLLVDEGRLGEKVAPGPTLDRIRSLAEEVRGGVVVLERHAAIGVYDGPFVPVVGPEELVQVRARRLIVATGALETHPVFPGNDLPGVWLGRGAARLAGVHGVRPGDRAVVVAGTAEASEHVETLRAAGVEIAEVVEDPPLRAEGRRRVRGVVLADGRRVPCDALVVSLGPSPRDGLLRMADDPAVVGAGEVDLPGCTLDEAEDSGARAGSGEGTAPRPPVERAPAGAGFVCLCEDVDVGDLERAWSEGFTGSEILKRYTTATMGPCQGALCGRHLAAFAASRTSEPSSGSRTTSRPPARPVALEELAGAVDEVIERRTSLHDVHAAAGAVLGFSGAWKRPFRYGDVAEEYRAVRERVSVMDVGTLGKFLVAGRDAPELLERVFPSRVSDLAPGRSRYALSLDEAGYVRDDGVVCALGDGSYYLTSTSGGADAMEAWLRDVADRWGLHAHLVNQTATIGAINVAGPLARELVGRLTDDPVDAASLPYGAHSEIVAAGVRCRALRVGFVGELSFELHHPRSRGPELWGALMAAGGDLGIRPHGLDALELLRLEKGHLYLLQDTLPDDHPWKLGLGWTVAMDKPAFVGKAALQRMSALPLERKLVGLRFDRTPQRGAPLEADGRIVGRITSCAASPALGYPVGLGWVRAIDGAFPETLRSNGTTATVVPTPFYDPEGARLRA